MKGNFHVRFLEGDGLATARLHSVTAPLPLQGREFQEGAAGVRNKNTSSPGLTSPRCPQPIIRQNAVCVRW